MATAEKTRPARLTTFRLFSLVRPRIGVALVVSLLGLGLSTQAHETGRNLDEVLASKRMADISFAQLMQILQQGTEMIFAGIMQENAELVAFGARVLDEHPAPRGGPTVAFVPEKREEIKRVMPAYNQLFHQTAVRIRAAAQQGRWQDAYEGYQEISAACVACHIAWRPHALSRQNALRR